MNNFLQIGPTNSHNYYSQHPEQQERSLMTTLLINASLTNWSLESGSSKLTLGDRETHVGLDNPHWHISGTAGGVNRKINIDDMTTENVRNAFDAISKEVAPQ